MIALVIINSLCHKERKIIGCRTIKDVTIMMQNYDMMIQEKSERVFTVMEKRVSPEDV